VNQPQSHRNKLHILFIITILEVKCFTVLPVVFLRVLHKGNVLSIIQYIYCEKI